MEKYDLILIGAGKMAINYIDVLKAQLVNFAVICRNINRAKELKIKKEIEIFDGGIDFFIEKSIRIPNMAIVCVDEKNLYEVTKSLIKAGVKNILVEKPCGVNKIQINSLNKISEIYSTKILVAYNRRFYESVHNAKNIINEDGGVRSCFFEFTEWTHQFEKLNVKDIFKEKLLICNSSHVLDLFIFFCGSPKNLNCFRSGELEWHKSASVFSGSGISKKGVIFSYIADWESAGRWNLELTTKYRRLYFSPLEKLFCVDRGKLEKYEIKPKNNLDIEYKPGLYKMVKSFRENLHKDFCSIKDQKQNFEFYYKIANY